MPCCGSDVFACNNNDYVVYGWVMLGVLKLYRVCVRGMCSGLKR